MVTPGRIDADRSTRPAVDVAALADELVALGTQQLGLDAVGITSAAPFLDTRAVLQERKAAGLHGGMAFTYRTPARSTDPSRTVPGAAALVVAARGYRRRAAFDGVPEPHGEVAAYSWEDHYAPLRDALGQLAARLRADGYRAEVVVDDNALVDRAAAYRAGLGWFGKNTLLLLPGRGSWFVLGSVITDAPLPATATELVEDGCGSCERCIHACPTGAIIAPGVLDARRCLAWLLEAPGAFPRQHRIALGGRIYGCDECQEVCPPNRVEERRNPPPAQAATAEPWVDLVAMLDMDDDALLTHFGRWYIPQRNAAYLRRNALIALANVGDPADDRVASAVARALVHRDPIVRGPAVWAAARLGRPDLSAALERLRRRETHPDVLDELADTPLPRVATGAR